MRNFTLLALGCILSASTAMAQSPALMQAKMAQRAGGTMPATTEMASTAVGRMAVRNATATPTGRPAMKAPAAVGEFPDYDGEMPTTIFEIPEGDTNLYSKACAGMYLIWSYIFNYAEPMLPAYLTFCDNGDVYIQNLFTQRPVGSYVKGKLSDDGTQIRVDLPQDYTELLYDEEAGYYWEVVTRVTELATETIDGVTHFDAKLPEAADNYLLFDVGADGVISLAEGFEVALVYSDNDYFAGFYDTTQSYTRFNDTPISLPDGVEAERWAMTAEDDYGDPVNSVINVAIDGSTVYVSGVFNDMADAWIKGEISGDKVTFKSGQYMGVNTLYNYFTYLTFGLDNPNYDEEDPENEEHYLIAYEGDYTFDFDADNLVLTPTDPSIYLFANVYPEYVDEFSFINMLVNPVIYYSEFGPATPQDPIVLFWEDCQEQGGYDVFYFEMPIMDTEGNMLDPSCYYYNIFIDGSLWTFTSYECIYLLETYGKDTMTDVPYTFSDDWDFSAYGEQHGVSLNFSGYDTVGVRGMYTKNGVTNYSRIVTYDIATGTTTTEEGPTSAIEAVDASSQVASVAYYDLQGRPVIAPAKGLYIKTTTLSDGSVRTTKELVR